MGLKHYYGRYKCQTHPNLLGSNGLVVERIGLNTNNYASVSNKCGQLYESDHVSPFKFISSQRREKMM